MTSEAAAAIDAAAPAGGVGEDTDGRSAKENYGHRAFIFYVFWPLSSHTVPTA